ncbi:MAG: efflux RND transporter periplasmic adaptor subunit [Thiotrichales bacterium]
MNYKARYRAGLLLVLLLITPFAFAAEDAERAHRVTVVPLMKLLFRIQESASASTISRNNSLISAQISATITHMPVLAGDKVEHGQTLVELDCSDARLARDIANAQLGLAQKEAARATTLQQTSSIAEQNFNQAQTNLELAKIALQQARLQVSRCRITAAYNGVVTKRLASVGDLAAPGSPLLRLVSTDDVELSAQIPAAKLESLLASPSPEYHFQGQTYPVSLRAALPVIDPASLMTEVRFQFQSRPAPVGSTGRLLWQPTAKFIPPDALVTRNGLTGIFILDGHKAKFHNLPGAIMGKPASSDLPPQTFVIEDGRYSLQDGDRVEVVN